MHRIETGIIYRNTLEELLRRDGFHPFFHDEKPFPVRIRPEVREIKNIKMTASRNEVIGLRGLLFSSRIPLEETRQMGFTWEFRDIPLNVKFLFLTIHHNGQGLTTCPRGHHTDDLSLVLNIPNAASPAIYTSFFKSAAYQKMYQGILSDAEARYIFRDKYIYSGGKPPLIIIGHGGGNPKTVSDKDAVITEEYIQEVLNMVDPREYSLVLDTTCNGNINGVPLIKPGKVPYFGAVGRLGTGYLPSYVHFPDGSTKWFTPTNE